MIIRNRAGSALLALALVAATAPAFADPINNPPAPAPSPAKKAPTHSMHHVHTTHHSVKKVKAAAPAATPAPPSAAKP